MTMTIVGGKPKTKKMDEMSNGEICFLESQRCYILRIGHGDRSLFLILQDYDDGTCDCDHFDFQASKHHTVRELNNDESITIKFA